MLRPSPENDGALSTVLGTSTLDALSSGKARVHRTRFLSGFGHPDFSNDEKPGKAASARRTAGEKSTVGVGRAPGGAGYFKPGPELPHKSSFTVPFRHRSRTHGCYAPGGLGTLPGERRLWNDLAWAGWLIQVEKKIRGFPQSKLGAISGPGLGSKSPPPPPPRSRAWLRRERERCPWWVRETLNPATRGGVIPAGLA